MKHVLTANGLVDPKEVPLFIGRSKVMKFKTDIQEKNVTLLMLKNVLILKVKIVAVPLHFHLLLIIYDI